MKRRNRPAHAFVAQSLLVHALDPARLRASAGELDWEQVRALSEPVGLLPFVWNAVLAAGLEAEVPPELAEAARAETARNAAQNLLLLEALRTVAGALQAGGVPCLALKGAALLLVDPGLLPLRHLSDLDVLIPPEDVLRADALLRGAGLRRSAEARDFRGTLLHGEAALAAGVYQTFAYAAPGDLLVELHHAPSGRPGQLLRLDGLWNRAGAAEHRGGRLGVPSLDDQLAIVAVHALQHHADDVRPLPRHVADVHALLRLGADPARAAGLLEEGPLRDTVAASLALIEEAAGERAGAGRIALALDPDVDRVTRVRLRLERAWVSTRIAAARVRRGGWGALFPDREYLRGIYGDRVDRPCGRAWAYAHRAVARLRQAAGVRLRKTPRR